MPDSPTAPFELGDGPDACLLLHGFSGAPSEVRPLGERLARGGMRVVAPLLPGHGTSAALLREVSRADLLAAARAVVDGLSGARRVFLGGLSAGAMLAITKYVLAEMPHHGNVVDFDVEGRIERYVGAGLAFTRLRHEGQCAQHNGLPVSAQPFRDFGLCLGVEGLPLGTDHLAQIHGIHRGLVGNPMIKLAPLRDWPVKQDWTKRKSRTFPHRHFLRYAPSVVD